MNNLELAEEKKKGKKINLTVPIQTTIIPFEPRLFVEQLATVRTSLQSSGVMRRVTNTGIQQSHYTINSAYNNDDSYFIMPFRIEDDDKYQDFKLVFRARDFYLQGVVTFENSHADDGVGHYYYFKDASITGIEEVQDDTDNKKYNHQITQVASSGYVELMRKHGEESVFTWESISQSFRRMLQPGNTQTTGLDFTRVIVAVAETIRFRSVGRMILDSQSSTRQYLWRDFQPIVTDWNRTTSDAITYLQQHSNLDGFSGNDVIYLFTIAMALYATACGNSSKTVTVCTEESLLEKDINYSFYDTYYWSDNDSSGNYQLFNWKEKANSWSDFIAKYPYFRLHGHIIAGVERWSTHNTNFMYDQTKMIGDSNSSYLLGSNYFLTSSTYTVIIFILWHDDNNVYFRWFAYMKGDATNIIDIKIEKIMFYQ